MAKTLVSLATYNEIENLPPLVEQIFAVVPQADLLVVDDNSPDGTGRWCDERAAADGRVRCLHRPGKLGLGSAIKAAMRYAMDHGYENLVTMDADFSHPPANLPDLLAGTDRADVVIGSRYCRGGGIKGWPLWRRMASRGINTAAHRLLGLPVRDASGAYRCYRVDVLRRVDLEAIPSSGYAFMEEILWHLKRAGARFAETPITFVDRVHGQSKVHWREAVGALGMLARLGLRNLRGR